MTTYSRNPAEEKNAPAAIEMGLDTTIDVNEVPHEVAILYCYQLINGKALVDRSEIDTFPDWITEGREAIIEDRISGQLWEEKQLETIFK